MGKFLSPEDQMRMLNERAKHSQKFEDDSNDKSFRDLATKSHKKNKKKKKNTAENESSVKYFNPFDGLFTNSEQEYSKSNITEMFEQKEDTVTDETEEFTVGMIQGKEENTELRNVFVCIMEELKRIVIDDGIAPKSFYFDSELIDVDNRLTDKDIEKSAEIIEKLTDYIISISHPTAVFKEEDILKAIYTEAEKSRRKGTLTNAEIDPFVATLSPMLNSGQVAKLKKLAETLKKI